MSTAGQAVGGVVGAVAGFFTPIGPVYGAQIGMMVGGYLDPVKTTTTGPRLDDLTVQTSTYGADIARGYGTFPVTGNVFWLENNKLKEVAKKKKSGGKGGPQVTNETFSYYATFAVGLLDCRDGVPIDGVRRIWINKKLFYDAGSTDMQTLIASNQASTLFTVHNGSETQMPDARMQATLGIANTPAYRGLAYIVFNDMPCTSLGGTQVTVEIVKSRTSSYVSNLIQKQFYQSFDNQSFAPRAYYIDLEKTVFYVPQWDYSYPSTSSFIRYIVYSDGSMSSGQIAVPGTKVPPFGRLDADTDYLYSTTDTFPSLYEFTGAGQVSKSGTLYVAVDNYGGYRIARRDFDRGLDEKIITVAYSLGGITTDGTYIYVVGDSATVKYDVELNPVLTGVGIVAGAPATGRAILDTDGALYFMTQPTSNTTIYKFSADLSSYSVWATGLDLPTVHTEIYIEGNILVAAAENPSPNRFLNVKYYCIDSITSQTISLSEIVQSECISSNLLGLEDIDTSLLTQQVRGYKISSTSTIRSALEPLQACWPFDCIQDGYKLRFVPRGGASVATIPAADLGARSASDSPVVSITNSREMDSQLPRRVTVNFLDADREYDKGTQTDQRLNTDSVNVRSMDLAVVLNATEALGVTQTLLYLYWLERHDLKFTLPPIWNALQPADTITVNANEASYTLRLTQITYTADGRLECTAKFAFAPIYTRNALGAFSQATGKTLSLAGESVFELLDIPVILDNQDAPGFVAAMSGVLGGWPGGELFSSSDNGQTWTDVQGFSSPGPAIGTASNTIGAVNNALIDTASVLNVTLVSGDLFNVSESAMFAGSNWFAYGVDGRWEIIAAKKCTLIGVETYAISDLLRGQRGTEWAMGLHVIGDHLIELDSSSVAFIGASLNSIGSAKTYRGVTIGRTLDSASDTAFTYGGVNLKPLSPIYLNGNRHPINKDWYIEWVRRTRVGGAWRDYVDASMGEASESYEVEIDAVYNGDAQYANVGLLLKFNGANSSTAIADEKGKTVTNSGVYLTTTDFITGGSSGSFNGGSALSIPSSADFDFGTGYFSIEFWINPGVVTGTQIIVSRQEAGAGMALQIGLSGATPIITMRSVGGTGLITIVSTGTIPANQWSRLKFTRSGTTVTIYINEVAAGTGTASNTLTPSVSRPLSIGCLDDTSLSSYFIGKIDELRVTKAYARPAVIPLETDLPNSSFIGIASTRLLKSTVQNVLYSSTLQAQDFGTPPTTISGRIYQMSADVGRGYPLNFSITR